MCDSGKYITKKNMFYNHFYPYKCLTEINMKMYVCALSNL